MNNYTPIIGLEIHVELATKSKMFCGCDANYFGGKPNTHTCPVCLGLPGALPVPNKKAIEWCIRIGLALNCEIPLHSKFDRKNYFYPDLPKGYQISQYDKPFAVNGRLVIKPFARGPLTKTVRIRRVHMEEDTGKLIHATVDGEKCTLIDFNRSGVPLVEIVTEPDIRTSEEARDFLKKLHQIIRYLGVSDADMEKGSMRLEPNISIRRKSEKEKERKGEENLPKYKVEVKNINSFNFAKKAIDYEISRHIELLDSGETPKQETRGWDEKKNITYSQRSKEEAHDYSYFPEPDIPPIVLSEKEKKRIRETIPELPDARTERFIKDYGLSEYDASILIDDKDTSEYFEKSIQQITNNKQQITPKVIANWIINKKADKSTVSPEELIKLITAKQQKPQMDATDLDLIIKKVIEANPKAVGNYKSGKEGAIMYLIGQVMRKTKGKANASQVRNLLTNLLK